MLCAAGVPGDLGVLDEPDTPPVLLQFDVPLLQGLLDGISEEEQKLDLAQRAWSQDSKVSNNFSRCL